MVASMHLEPLTHVRTALHAIPVGKRAAMLDNLSDIDDGILECDRSGAASPLWSVAAARHSASRARRSCAIAPRSPLSQAISSYSSRSCELSWDDYQELVGPPLPESLLFNTKLFGADGRTSLQHAEKSRYSSRRHSA